VIGLTTGADSLSGELTRAVVANDTRDQPPPTRGGDGPPHALTDRGRGAAIIDRITAYVVNLGEIGRVRVGDSDWAARVPTDVPEPQVGARLRIEGVDGTVLIVRPEG
jgi:hypothetical protein